MKVYSVFCLVNLAETWRDADDITRTDLGVFKKLKDAKKAVFNRVNEVAIKLKYETQKVDWTKCKDKNYPNSIYFEDTGSWAPTYIIQTIDIKK